MKNALLTAHVKNGGPSAAKLSENTVKIKQIFIKQLTYDVDLAIICSDLIFGVTA